MDAEIAALEASREKTRSLKQGMMQEFLAGENPADVSGIAKTCSGCYCWLI